jgi:glycolate oxidase
MCSLGGNVAENAGGPRAFRYGVTREYEGGLEVVMAGGQVMRPGRRTVKGVTGYDVTALFVGSEGTLGVTTEITLKLLPLPPAVGTMLALFRDLEAASRAVTLIVGSGHRPRALELMDRAALDHVRPKAPIKLPLEAEAALLIEVDGEPEAIEPQCLRIADTCEQAGAYDVMVARDDKDRRQLWATRRIVSPSLREGHLWKVSEDIVVPRGAIPIMVERVHEIGKRAGLAVASYGHAGDGNLHVNVLCDEPRENPAVAARVKGVVAGVFRTTLDLGGTISGEHGIGIAKRDYVAWEQALELIEFQRKLKQLCDPTGILNPGKMLPTGHSE